MSNTCSEEPLLFLWREAARRRGGDARQGAEAEDAGISLACLLACLLGGPVAMKPGAPKVEVRLWLLHLSVGWLEGDQLPGLAHRPSSVLLLLQCGV